MKMYSIQDTHSATVGEHASYRTYIKLSQSSVEQLSGLLETIATRQVSLLFYKMDKKAMTRNRSGPTLATPWQTSNWQVIYEFVAIPAAVYHIPYIHPSLTIQKDSKTTISTLSLQELEYHAFSHCLTFYIVKFQQCCLSVIHTPP